MTMTAEQWRQAGEAEREALSQWAPGNPIAHVQDARQAGAETATRNITAQADAGMTADRIERASEGVLSGRFEKASPQSDAFYSEYDQTAATLTRELREIEAE